MLRRLSQFGKCGRCELLQRSSVTPCFLARLKHIQTSEQGTDSKFGSIADSTAPKSISSVLPPSKFKTFEDLEDDDGESKHFAKISDIYRPMPFEFESKIVGLLEKNDLHGALKVFDEEMAEEKVSPTKHTHKLLIHACGKSGYAPKALAILKRFRSTGEMPSFDMYADVFNACAKAPKDLKSSEIALKVAQSARHNLSKLVQEPLPLPLYHTMIAAFGHCKDLDMAFAIVDEMTSKGLNLTSETYCHLLHACISDKESGFRLAMVVYRRLLQQKLLKPDVHVFNLLLRAAKDCGIGPESFVNDLLIEAMTSQEARKFLEANERKLLDSSRSETEPLIPKVKEGKTDLELVHRKSDLAAIERQPNLLEVKPFFDNLVGLNADLSTARKRFQLIGDLDGFIAVATSDFNAALDIKTMSLLISVIENTVEAEEKLMRHMRRLQIKPDVDFFNQLIRRRVARYDYENAKEVLDNMSEFNLSPDIVTYGNLSLACSKPGDIFQVLRDMEALNIRPNVHIMTILLSNASSLKRPYHVRALLNMLDKYEIQPDHVLISKVENFYNTYQRIISDVEKKSNKKPPHPVIIAEFNDGLKNWQDFCSFYHKWLKRAKVVLPEHPWNQYKTKKDARRKF